MLLLRPGRSVLTLMMGLLLLLACSAPLVRAQERQAVAAALSDVLVDENANLDVEIYLLAASDAAAEGGRLPSQLEPVVKQLRATLPFGSYRLSGTMVNRTKNGGRLIVTGVGAATLSKITAPAPLFSEYSIGAVKLENDAAGQTIVELSNFKFGARVPIQTSTTAGTGGTSSSVIQYENTGITTEFSMREGEPVVVGTLNVGQTGEVFILIVSAKRTKEK